MLDRHRSGITKLLGNAYDVKELWADSFGNMLQPFSFAELRAVSICLGLFVAM